MTDSNSSVASSAPSKLGLLLAVFVMLVAGCGSTAEPLDAEVARLLDTNGNRIADLTPADGAEDVPSEALLRSVARADSVGTALRVVVASPDGEFVSAKSVVDRYGGTVISYQANRTGFEGASRDMTADQLDRAIDAARVELDIGESAAAFVGVLESEGLESRGSSITSTVLLLLLIPAAAFMLWGAWSYFTARKRRLKRQRSFDERKKVLVDWAAQLGPEVESLRADVVASADDGAQQTWHESREFVTKIVPTVEAAQTVGDLDGAEMRIGRVAIKLRELRKSLESTF